MLLVALLSLWFPAYAHYRLASHSARKPRPNWLIQILLVAVGLGFGWTMSTVYMDIDGEYKVWTFILAFSAVHVPAAIILWLKKLRNDQLK